MSKDVSVEFRKMWNVANDLAKRECKGSDGNYIAAAIQSKRNEFLLMMVGMSTDKIYNSDGGTVVD